MNILSKALSDLFFTIPTPILEQAFMEEGQNWRHAVTSLEDRIMNRILRPRVMLDANLVGGQMVVLNLDTISPQYIDNTTVVYQIPPERLNNRNIISVLSVGYMTYTSTYHQVGSGIGSINTNSMSDLMSAGQRVGDSMSNVPAISIANVELVGHNTIMIRDGLRMSNMYQVRLVVGNDPDMGNINPRCFLAFSRLCELAVKSYIYNKLIISMDTAYLLGGQELGVFKSIVEGYSDAEEMYKTHLNEVWGAVNFMNSKVDYTRFIRMQISPGL